MILRVLINLKNELFILCILMLIQTSKQSNVKGEFFNFSQLAYDSFLFYFYVLFNKFSIFAFQVGSCPEGYSDWYPNSEFCYLIYSEQVTWTEALEHCTGKGGNLPSVNSPEEQDVLRQNAFQQGANAWIGLRAESRFIYDC